MHDSARGSKQPSSSPLLNQSTQYDEESKQSPEAQTIDGWPADPQTLRQSSHPLFWRLLPHITNLLIPACFIVLGILLVRLSGDEQSEYGDHLLSAAGLAASIWPIAFAVVISSFLRSLALYKAEKGTRLGMLEVITTGQTFGSALRGTFMLRFWSTWTFFLLCLWILSPAGGQAVLRSVALKPIIENGETRVIYNPSTNLSVAMTYAGDPSYTSAYPPPSWDWLYATQAQLMFDAAVSSAYAPLHLIKPNQSDPYNPINYLGGMDEAMKAAEQDLWGDARVPQLELLAEYNADEPYAWVNVSDSKPPTYESLIGIQIHGLPQGSITNTSIQAEASYTTFNCSAWANLTDWLSENPYGLTYGNSSNELSLFYAPDRMNNVFLDILNHTGSDTSPTTSPDTAPTLLVGHSNDGYQYYWDYDPDAYYRRYMTACTPSTTHLDLEITCTRTSRTGETLCTALRARHSRAWPIHDPASTIFNTGNVTDWWGSTFWNAPSILQVADESSYSHISTTYADYLINLGLSRSSASYQNLYLDELDLPVLNARLAYLLNSWWRLNVYGNGALGIDGADKYTLKSESSPYFVTDAPPARTRTRREPPVYRVSWAYFTLYAAATAVVLLCAVADIALRAVIRAPDMLGGVSGLTRCSPYVDVPGVGSGMDSTERARLLRGRWVRIQDVRPEEEVGRIEFSDQRDLEAFKLEWGRRYE